MTPTAIHIADDLQARAQQMLNAAALLKGQDLTITTKIKR
jgi:Arc/MetJ family transcription regulator